MQDNQLHGNLTVEEAMTVATNLKLSTKVDKAGKIDVVSGIYEFYYHFYILQCLRILFMKKIKSKTKL